MTGVGWTFSLHPFDSGDLSSWAKAVQWRPSMMWCIIVHTCCRCSLRSIAFRCSFIHAARAAYKWLFRYYQLNSHNSVHRKITPLTVLPVYLSSFMRIGSMFMGWLLVTLLRLDPSVSSNLTQLWFDVLSVMISANNQKNWLISKFVASCKYVCTACSR